jgi:hypothetical protein
MMYRRAKNQTAFAWAAMLALLFGLLAPAAHHAIKPAMAEFQATEICTRSGATLYASDQSAATKPVTDLASDSSSHCGYCFSPGTTFILAPSALAVFQRTGQQVFVLPALSLAPVTRFAWTIAVSRAPPAFASFN